MQVISRSPLEDVQVKTLLSFLEAVGLMDVSCSSRSSSSYLLDILGMMSNNL
jgi:hypothetical protein